MRFEKGWIWLSDQGKITLLASLVGSLVLVGCQAPNSVPGETIELTATKPPEEKEELPTGQPPTSTPPPEPGQTAMLPAASRTITPEAIEPANTVPETSTPLARATPVHEPPASPTRPTSSAGAILIFGPGGATSDLSYEEAVLAAVTADLAERLGVPFEAISASSTSQIEVPLAAPCGTPAKAEDDPLGGGLALGYEVNLNSGGIHFRYLAVGGLAYFCPAP